MSIFNHNGLLCFVNMTSEKYICPQVIEEDGCQKTSKDVGTYFLLKLAKLRDELPIVGDVRGKGLMIGMEMVADKVCLCVNMVEQAKSGCQNIIYFIFVCFTLFSCCASTYSINVN